MNVQEFWLKTFPVSARSFCYVGFSGNEACANAAVSNVKKFGSSIGLVFRTYHSKKTGHGDTVLTRPKPLQYTTSETTLIPNVNGRCVEEQLLTYKILRIEELCLVVTRVVRRSSHNFLYGWTTCGHSGLFSGLFYRRHDSLATSFFEEVVLFR